ncbi:MAG: hypothetical protein WBH99_09485 [Azovibrio sp.]|uniref:hypothetical protein n=1 Tax=Azovibrio sp. TaxID=1872673 RepID=UPI003C7347AC
MRKRLLLPLLALMTLAACSKLTLANYDQLKLGMSLKEVSALIGEPDKCDETLAVRSCHWQQGESKVEVNFIGDQAILLDASQLK